MSPLPGSRTGIVVLTMERDQAAAGRLLIRVRTIVDALGSEPDVVRVFTACEPAIECVRDWLDAWTDEL
jgi:hypothetical protein